jgi:hypothetical protein
MRQFHVQSKRLITYLLVLADQPTSSQWPSSLATPCLPDGSQNCQKLGSAAFDL